MTVENSDFFALQFFLKVSENQQFIEHTKIKKGYN